jgi:uncharacterized protein (TIGR02246 family)
MCAVIGLGVAVGKDGPKKAEKGVAPVVEKGVPKPAATPNAKPAEKADEKPNPKADDKTTVNEPTVAKPSPDEEAILLTGETFVNAYAAADAKAIAAHYTPDAEYIDEQGNVFQGREAIQEDISAYFAAHPGAQMEMNIYSIRFISSGVAIEDGTTTVTTADEDAEPIHTHYTAVHVKTDGKWLTASVREQAPKDRRHHRTELQQLAWLQGDWVDEGEESVVIFSCAAVDGGNFLLRNFTIQIAGQEAMSGTQRIGWDPLTRKLRAWIFDSEGGFSDGLWHRDGDRWVLKSTGVTADGEPASSTSIYTFVNEHTMTWQSVDHEIAGVPFPDSEVVTIVRRAPTPESADDIPSTKSN